MLDYHPRTATEQRVRWKAAAATVWDFADLAGTGPPERDRPGLHPEHVLDFHDGIRLIVSRDLYGDGKVHLHVSASVRPDSKIGRALARRRTSFEQLLDLVVDRVRFLSGLTVTFGYVTRPKGIPHFFDPPIGGGRQPWTCNGNRGQEG